MQPEPESRLEIEVRDGPEAPPRRWTLECDPPGGDHPDPAGACAALAAARDPFAPVPDYLRCAQVYFGPERATITGRWRGVPVQAEYRRNDACQENRWRAVRPVLQPSPPRRHDDQGEPT